MNEFRVKCLITRTLTTAQVRFHNQPENLDGLHGLAPVLGYHPIRTITITCPPASTSQLHACLLYPPLWRPRLQSRAHTVYHRHTSARRPFCHPVIAGFVPKHGKDGIPAHPQLYRCRPSGRNAAAQTERAEVPKTCTFYLIVSLSCTLTLPLEIMLVRNFFTKYS